MLLSHYLSPILYIYWVLTDLTYIEADNWKCKNSRARINIMIKLKELVMH